MKGKSSGPKERERSKRPPWQKDIAEERITILFGLSEDEFKEHPERSHRYVALARKIGMRYNVKIPKELKRRVCNYCYSYLYPAKNCIVRSNSTKQAMEIRCLECDKVNRYPYNKEKGKLR